MRRDTGRRGVCAEGDVLGGCGAAIPGAAWGALLGLIPGLGRSPGEGNGNPRQYSCLENSMDIGA